MESVKSISYRTNVTFSKHETRTSYHTHVKPKKTKMPIYKGFQCRSKFACLYNSVKRLFPFICAVGICRPFFRFCMRPRAKPVFCRGSSALCASADTMTGEPSRSDNCWLNLGLNDFSHERERRCQCTFGTFERLKRRLYVTSVLEELWKIFLTNTIIYIVNKNYETNIANTSK